MLPLAKRVEILRRHDAVELLMSQESASETIQIRSSLAELGSVPKLCFLLNKGLGTAKTWEQLLKVRAA